ncbi:MAG: rRNA pseudouridine synthase [Lachnospiraceae bacterium]|nr:rRNA pseudouridine synthase [Lachnospiraceae bacterium]
MSEKLRLDRFISDCCDLSRKQAVPVIREGRVSVDGKVIKEPGLKIDDHASVMLDDKKLEYSRFCYYMFNKPAGCVSAVKDKLSETVLSYLKGVHIEGLFPIGRLDKDTEGLLFITNDGKLCHNLISPRKQVEKVYYVVSDKELDEKAFKAFEDGIDIGEEKKCLPAVIKAVDNMDDNTGYAYELTITEGRFHQVKRMFIAVGAKVMYLKRVAIGGVSLDRDLEKGAYRRLTKEEIELLKRE